MKLLFLLVFLYYFEKATSQPSQKIEISTNGVAALLSCHLNYLKEGTLGDVEQDTVPLNEKPYKKIRESIENCLVNINNNCGSIGNDIDKLDKFYEFIDKTLDNQIFENLIKSKNKTKMMYFGWILQILYYTVADKLAEKLFNSNVFEGGTVLAGIQKKIKLDENRYKDFRKNHLNRIIENFDNSLKIRKVNFYDNYKKIKNSLELNLEKCEITHNMWLFPQPYWWIRSKNNQGNNHFITPRTSTRPSTSSFPSTPPNEENDIGKNSLDNVPTPNCLKLSFVWPNIKTVFLLVNGNANDNELKKLKELFKKIPISHILAAPDTKSLKTATQISKNLETIRVKYDPGFAEVYEIYPSLLKY
uniref:Uncharacterized protein n=1 Tax=Meloidogyne enterolobii TaxID=390850 RepID=A0A6V7Y3F1_MELEN|nr:unnamed protein product [Meloidogyne enterolobii]